MVLAITIVLVLLMIGTNIYANIVINQKIADKSNRKKYKKVFFRDLAAVMSSIFTITILINNYSLLKKGALEVFYYIVIVVLLITQLVLAYFALPVLRRKWKDLKTLTEDQILEKISN